MAFRVVPVPEAPKCGKERPVVKRGCDRPFAEPIGTDDRSCHPDSVRYWSMV